jgi:hypothetical protein
MATNNIVLAAMPALPLPHDLTLPVHAVDELLRLAQEPAGVVVDENSAYFFLPNGVRLRAQRLQEQWPDAATVLEQAHAGAKLPPVAAATMREAVEAVQPFCADPSAPVVIVEGREVRTVDGEDEVLGARVEASGAWSKAGQRCVFRVEPLLSVLTVMTAWDLPQYPRVPWSGAGGLRGVLLGWGRGGGGAKANE